VTKTILVADDDPGIAELLVSSLTAEGYHVVKTTQSLRFYDVVMEHKPDLILLDLLMPYLEGEDELRLLQLQPETAHIPVIVVTAKSNVAAEAQQLYALGVRHIVQKPFELEHLLDLIEKTIG